MTTGILYICTGAYSIFWKDFYITANKYLFPGVIKKFFVFCDSSEIYGETNNPNIVKIPIEHKAWPYNTLLRFEMFYNHKNLFDGCDYLLFYNANTIFTTEILPEEILPEKEDGYLVALSNNDVNNFTPEQHTYDRNPASTAYIPFGQGKEYYRGCFNGGRTPEFLQLIKTCKEQTDIDLKNNVMALWHDESHLNKYLLNKPVKTISSVYGKPEEWQQPKEAKVIFSIKSKKIKDINRFKGIQIKYSLTRFIRKLCQARHVERSGAKSRRLIDTL
ncbi:MAG: glycosyl transferase [Candidatus Symbiothrix sp.]|jgi:hypothetical protein|nr:glycosyl transferase [Candidatus Symbiothrix sp.]